MRLQTKSNAPLEVEQEVTIELPFKRAQVVMAMVVIGLLVGVFVLSPPIAEPAAVQPLAQKAQRMPDQLQDLSAVAEYQFRLSGGDFGMVDSREFVVVEELSDQISDRQALADYQLHLSDGDLQRAASREFRRVQVMPDQIPDRQALADYQSLVGSGDFNALTEYQRPVDGSDSSPLRGRKLAEVVDKTRPPTTTSAEANKALIQRAYDEVLNNPNLVATDVCPIPMIYGRCAILNEAELAVVDELFAPNFRHDQAGLPVFSSGSQAVRLRLSVYRLAFPDLHYTVEALVAKGDQVVTRWQARGTHRGKFGLHDPTGEPMAWTGMTLWRIADGQIVEAWTIQQGPTFNVAPREE